MRGFILAAGLGTRLRPLTDVLPKPLVAVGGVPLLERTIGQMVAVGVREIAVNAFHLGDQIAAFVGDGSRWGAHITCFREGPEVLGTGGGLKNAEAWLAAGGDAFLLANGDVWHDFDLAALQAAHDGRSIATLALHRAPHRPELHTVAVVADSAGGGSVAHIRGKPFAKEADFQAIYTGVGVYSCRLLAQIPPQRQACLVQDGLLPAMARGDTVRWIEPRGHWFDCGTRAEVLRASAFALRARANSLRAASR